MVQEHYLGVIAAAFPNFLPRYDRAYRGTNISSDYQGAIERRLVTIRERHGFAEDAMQERRNAASPLTIAAKKVTNRTMQLPLLLR